MHVKRKLLFFNDVFQPLTPRSSTEQSTEIRQQKESVLPSFVCVDGPVSYLWGF